MQHQGVTAKEYAAQCGTSVSTVFKWAREGRLKTDANGNIFGELPKLPSLLIKTDRPTQKQIAAALGISTAAFTKCVKRGCPRHDLAAARTWREANLRSSLIKHNRGSGNCVASRASKAAHNALEQLARAKAHEEAIRAKKKASDSNAKDAEIERRLLVAERQELMRRARLMEIAIRSRTPEKRQELVEWLETPAGRAYQARRALRVNSPLPVEIIDLYFLIKGSKTNEPR